MYVSSSQLYIGSHRYENAPRNTASLGVEDFDAMRQESTARMMLRTILQEIAEQRQEAPIAPQTSPKGLRVAEIVRLGIEASSDYAEHIARRLGRFVVRHRVGLAGLVTATTGLVAIGMAVKSAFDINVYATYQELFNTVTKQDAVSLAAQRNIGLEVTVGSINAAVSVPAGLGYLTLRNARDEAIMQPNSVGTSAQNGYEDDEPGGLAILSAIMDDQTYGSDS